MPADRDSGAVLVVAMLILVAVVSFGLAYAEVSAHHSAVVELGRERAALVSVAEGGLDAAYLALSSNPSFRGSVGPLSVGGTSVTATVSEVAGGLRVLALADHVDHYCGYLSEAELCVQTTIRDPIVISHDVTFENSWLTVGGELQYGGSYSITGGGLDGDVVSGSDFPGLSLNAALFKGLADVEYTGTTTLGPGRIEGNVYCQGDTTIEGPATIHGTLFVTGQLTIDGNGGQVVLASSEDATVLLSQGKVEISNVSHLKIAGSMFLNNDLTLTDVTMMEALGSVVARGLTLTNVGGSWEYDPRLLRDPPVAVSGGRQESTVVENWRRSFTVEEGEEAVLDGFGGGNALEFDGPLLPSG